MTTPSKQMALGNRELVVCIVVFIFTAAAQAQDVSFLPPQSFRVGTEPRSVAVADFNADGWLDLAVANSASHSVSVLLGNGDGTFQAARNFRGGYNPNSVAVGDFNGDGRQDLAVANVSFHSVGLFLGNGDGTFQAPLYFPASSFPGFVAVGDFNGDGRPDLVVANSILSNTVSVLINDTPRSVSR